MHLHGAAQRLVWHKVPSSVSHKDHAGIGDETFVSPVNWCVSSCGVLSNRVFPQKENSSH